MFQVLFLILIIFLFSAKSGGGGAKKWWGRGPTSPSPSAVPENAIQPPLLFKAGSFRYQCAITYSLVVAQPIRTQH